jgi:hypothetical protein
MKALMSPLARAILADPKAKGQMREFIAAKSDIAAAGAGERDDFIEVQFEGRMRHVQPVLVPKAT